VAPADDGHVAPGEAALAVRLAQQFGDPVGFVTQAGQPDDQRWLAIAAAADGVQQRDAVVVGVIGRQQVGGDQAGGLEDLARARVTRRASCP